MRILTLLVIGIALTGCITINNSALSGEKNSVKTDADAKQNINPKADGNNVSLMPK